MNRSRGLARGFPLLPLVLGAWLTGCREGGLPTQPPLEATANAAHSVAVARVSGGGGATVTDVDGLEYRARFAISGVLDPAGTARGLINFVFGPEFSEAWGVEPGVHKIHVWGKVTSITVGYGGAVTLTGTATEVEISPGSKQIVFEDEPFEVVITGPGTFTFWWCELPPFDFQVTNGTLTYDG